jgi:hypothetical protein
MRWLLPDSSSVRFRKKFAWLPIIVENHRIWLEFYEIEEQFILSRWVYQGAYLINKKS